MIELSFRVKRINLENVITDLAMVLWLRPLNIENFLSCFLKERKYKIDWIRITEKERDWNRNIE